MRPWNPNTKSTGRPRELNPGSSDRPSRLVRTVSQPTEPPRQAYVYTYMHELRSFSSVGLLLQSSWTLPWYLKPTVSACVMQSLCTHEVRLYSACVMTVLLCGCETWKLNKHMWLKSKQSICNVSAESSPSSGTTSSQTLQWPPQRH